MNERRDGTTEPGADSPRAPGAYYYDDATGYEVFDPARPDEEGDEGGDGAGRREDPGAPAREGSGASAGPFSVFPS